MKALTSTAIVAIVAGTIGFATLSPAFAQQAQQPGGQQFGQQQFGHHMQMNPGQMGQFNQRFEHMRNARNPNGVRPGALLDLVCSGDGAERTELGFVRLSYRLDLTAEQQTLFDDLRTAALTAQTQYADQCAAPGAGDATAETAQPTPPTPVERLSAQIDNDTVRLDLMKGLLPKLEALYNSLTDAQKATLQPQRGADNGTGFRHRHGNMPGMPMPGQPGAMPAPGQPGQPGELAAPDAAAPATPAPTQG
jgi:hypothetical protein